MSSHAAYTDVERQDNPKTLPLPRCPRAIQYIPVPGAWARKEHPHWHDSVFRKPDKVQEGEVYYFSKGRFIGLGSTAFVELLPSGHIVKTPKMNPYDLDAERSNRQSMQREASIYQLPRGCPYIPRFIEWDHEACTLTLEYLANGDLEHYIREHSKHSGSDSNAQASLRRKWAFQAAQALAAVHDAGVTHRDIAPRNFILDQDLNLRICDFAGSSTETAMSEHAPGPGFQRQSWGRACLVSQADDVFGLGSVIYYIMAHEEPYSGLDEDEVDRRFWRQEYPKVDHLDGGCIIEGCWRGHLVTATEVMSALADEFQLDMAALGVEAQF